MATKCVKCRGSGINEFGLLCSCVNLRQPDLTPAALYGVTFTDADGRGVQIDDMDEETLLRTIREIEGMWCRARLDLDSIGDDGQKKKKMPQEIFYYERLCALARARGIDPFEVEEVTEEIRTYKRRQLGGTEIKA